MIRKITFPVAFLSIALTSILFVSCKEKELNPEKMKETVVEGKTTILVDQTIQPIIEDQAQVFESQYRAKLELICKTETEVVNDLINGKAGIAILPRTLTPEEQKVFNKKEIVGKITPFATDGIALISNKSQDTIVDLEQILALLQGKSSKVKGLVFENANASTFTYLKGLAGLKDVPKNGVYALNSQTEVFKHIAENPGLIGVVGLNTIVQPTQENKQYLDDVNVMAVKNLSSKPNHAQYYKPSQANLAGGLYPLSRTLYMLNYQGMDGLGMGFASFIAGELGQRIVLKSGLLPVRTPSRTIVIRKEILKNK